MENGGSLNGETVAAARLHPRVSQPAATRARLTDLEKTRENTQNHGGTGKTGMGVATQVRICDPSMLLTYSNIPAYKYALI